MIELGTKTAEFVRTTLYAGNQAVDNINPDLSVDHINALADYITEDTILDIKVTNRIDETYIKQVLAYHYLSTKRDDVCIKRVIVYDATSGHSVTVNISDKNIAKDRRKLLTTYITKVQAESDEIVKCQLSKIEAHEKKA